LFKLLILGFYAGLISGPQPAVAQVESDEKLLQGTWEVVSSESDGKAGTGHTFVFVRIPIDVGARFTFKGDLITYTTTGKAEEGRSSFTLRSKVSPKEIDWVHPTPEMEQLGVESCKYKGIYSIQGDTLKLCYIIRNGQRPTTFQTAKGDGCTLWALKRVAATKKEVEPDGAANGSQPIRSETNSTSSAAGSRR
jgi:uncharacterized protein (TIGR03067 family)